MTTTKFKKKSGLGKGLGAILDHTDNHLGDTQKDGSVGSVSEIKIENITSNPWQPRSEFDKIAILQLAESIKQQGIIQPITVRMLNNHSFQLISGERRLQACKTIKLETIPAYIREADDQQMLEMALIENIQRENLNAIEIALSFQRLLSECELKQEELGQRVGKNRSTVTNYLRLLKLPPDIQVAVRDHKLSMGHAKTLINIEDIALQLDIFHQIIDQDLSVRDVEELVKSLKQGKPEKIKKTSYENPEINDLKNRLSAHFESKVAIKSNNLNKGEIKIPFHSTEDLNRILEILNV